MTDALQEHCAHQDMGHGSMAGHFMAEAMPLDALMLVGTGLAISLGHCLGMCGPLVGSLAAAQQSRGLRFGGVLVAQLLHHAGRVTSYAVIGFVLGAVGSAVRLTGLGRDLQGTLSLVVGLVMVLLGMGLLGWLPTRRWVESGRLAGVVIRGTARLRNARGAGAWFLVGMANGFLPCGPVYAVAAGTVVSSPLAGAAGMALFGLGTMPALLLLAMGTERLSPRFQRRLNRLAGVLVLLIGIQLICRGAAAMGWIGHLRFGELVIW